MSKGAPGVRYAEVEREASGVRVRVVLDLDGGTKRDIATGVPFFDRLLARLAFQGMFDLGVQADSTNPEDDHHTLEEVGIALGQALRAAMADTDSVHRLGSATVAKDDALVLVAIDAGGRGQLYYDVSLASPTVAGVSSQSFREFFRGMVVQGSMTVHVRRLAGEDDHHACEAMFKAFGAALGQATRAPERRSGAGSGKGSG